MIQKVEIRELTADEISLISGGDKMTYSWGTYVGNGLRDAWNAWSAYASSDEASQTVVP